MAHDELDGVRDGMMAVEAYREAIDPATTPERRLEIENQLLAYCALDTLALVHLWRHLCGEPQAGAEQLPGTDTGARTGTGADVSSDRITGGRLVILDPLRFEPYEHAATLFTLLAFPDESEKHRDEVHAALCRQAIETSASGVEGIAPVTPKPVYFDLDIEAAARIVEQTGRRLGQRLEAAHVGIGLLREQLGLPLPQGVRRPSVNEFSRKLLGFREDGGDEGNFKNRVLGPSYPVLHLAIAFAIELDRLERQGLKRASLDRLLLMPHSIDTILRDAQEFESRILTIPRIRIDPDRLVRCGACGSTMAAIGKDYLGCSNARGAGICDNRRSVRRTAIETIVLDALRTQLMQPEALAAFIEAANARLGELSRERDRRNRQQDSELTRIGRQIERLIDAIADGYRTPNMKEKLFRLEARKAELLAGQACKRQHAQSARAPISRSFCFHGASTTCDTLRAPDMTKPARY